MPRYRGLAPATADDESGCLYCKFTVEANIRRPAPQGARCFQDRSRIRWLPARASRPQAATRLIPESGQSRNHSITLVACTRIELGIFSPSALAVLRLTTSSNLVGCSTGRSAGLAPLRILST